MADGFRTGDRAGPVRGPWWGRGEMRGHSTATARARLWYINAAAPAGMARDGPKEIRHLSILDLNAYTSSDHGAASFSAFIHRGPAGPSAGLGRHRVGDAVAARRRRCVRRSLRSARPARLRAGLPAPG